MKTQTIAGHKITLEEGVRYFASRPFCKRGPIDQQRFTVSIAPLRGASYFAEPVVKIVDLTYDQANEFLSEFNNGAISLSGRVW